MKKLTKAVALLLAAILAVSAVGCDGGGTDTTAAPQGGTTSAQGGETKSADTTPAGPVATGKTELIFVTDSDNGAYDEFAVAKTAQTGTVTAHVFDQLFYSNKEGGYTNMLAENYEWKDDKTLQVKVRENVFFHNGDPLTMEDIIWSLECHKKVRAALYATIDECVKIDEHTVEFHMNTADRSVVSSLAAMIIGPKNYYNEVGPEAFAVHPVGTGCYYWADYTSGDHVTLKYFDKYWGEHGTVDTIQIRFISEVSQALIELENGNCDVLKADGASIPLIEGNENLAYSFSVPGLNEYLGFNYNNEIFQDVRIRQAVNMAIQREQILAGARDNIGMVSYGFAAPTSSVYDPAIEDYYKYDPEGAAKLMEEAGYTKANPLKLTLLTDTSKARQAESQQVKNFLDQVGFEITLQNYDSATVSSMVAGGNPDDYDLIIRAINQGEEQAERLKAQLRCYATTTGSNPTWLNDTVPGAKEYDELVAKAQACVGDEAQFAELMKQVQKTERENALFCPLLFQQDVYFYNAKLHGCALLDASLPGSINRSIHFEGAYFTE